MKRLALFFLLISSHIFAQRAKPANFKLGLKDGASTSRVSGGDYRGFHKFGFIGGIYLKGRLNDDWDIAIEAAFVQCGSRHNSNYAKGDFNNYFLQLDYIQVPVLFEYNYAGLSVEFGPGCGFLVHKKELVTDNGAETDATSSINDEDINLNVGLGYTFNSNFGFNFRYTNSIIPIRSSATKRIGQLNTVLALCLVYEIELRKSFRD